MPSEPLSSPRKETSIATECSLLPCLSRALPIQSIIISQIILIKFYITTGTTKYLVVAFIQNLLPLLAEIPAGFLLAGLR